MELHEELELYRNILGGRRYSSFDHTTSKCKCGWISWTCACDASDKRIMEGECILNTEGKCLDRERKTFVQYPCYIPLEVSYFRRLSGLGILLTSAFNRHGGFDGLSSKQKNDFLDSAKDIANEYRKLSTAYIYLSTRIGNPRNFDTGNNSLEPLIEGGKKFVNDFVDEKISEDK